LELEAVRDTAAEFLATSDPEATAKAADSHGQMKQYAERDLAANLIGLRMSLREMPAEKATVIDKYFEHGVPDILRRGNKGHSDAPRPWNEWLADSYLGASDAQLLNLLQWHVNSMDEIAEHPDVTAEVASLRGEYRQKSGRHWLTAGWCSVIRVTTWPSWMTLRFDLVMSLTRCYKIVWATSWPARTR
jgi:hypothetical protein